MDLPQTKTLLKSAELATVQDLIIEGRGLEVLPEPFATPFQQMLNWLEIGSHEILEVFGMERETFVEFAKAIQQLSAEESIDGEFPPGEEPGPDDYSSGEEVLGISSGFAILHACEFIILRDRGQAELRGFYKWKRFPYAGRYAKEVYGKFERIRGSR